MSKKNNNDNSSRFGLGVRIALIALCALMVFGSVGLIIALLVP